MSWELDFWGRLRNTRDEARANLLARKASRRAVLLTLVGNVATAYLELRQADLDLEIARGRLIRGRRRTGCLRPSSTGGRSPSSTYGSSKATSAKRPSSVALYEKEVAQAENQLSLLLGRSPSSIPRGRPLTDVLNAVELPVGVPSQLLERRPDVRQAEAQVRASTFAVGTAIDARLPAFAVNGYWGYEGFSGTQYFPGGQFTAQNNQLYSIYLGLTIPVFDFGVLANQQHAAEARVVEARNTYEKAVLTALRDVNNYLTEVRTDRQQTVALQTQVQALRIAYRLSRDKYEAGYAPYLDVLTAQRTLFTAEQALVSAEYQALAGVVDLFQALGGGWPTHDAAASSAGH